MFQDQLLARIRDKFASRKFRIGFPEDLDPRVHEATQKLVSFGLLSKIVLFSSEPDFFATCSAEFKSFLLKDSSFEFVNQIHSQIQKKIFEKLKQKALAKKRRVNEKELDRKSKHPLYQSLYLLSLGELDCVVAGCCYTTKEVIRAGLEMLGLKTGSSTINSSTLFIREGEQEFKALYADCGVIMNPSAEQLVDITEATVNSWHNYSFLFPEKKPCIAFLSFASHDSAFDKSVVKVSKAREMFAMRNPGLKVDGPLQFDAAFDQTVRSKKLKVNALGNDRVNIYVFPDLNAGNIAYKITQRLAACESYGPLLQGYAYPFSDLSRGATSDDIVMAACLKILECAA